MPRCAGCKSFIVMGGYRHSGLRFCNQACYDRSYVPRLAAQLPSEIVDKYVAMIHLGNCPKCGGPGPVDVHLSHRVWSAAYLTRATSRPDICCRSCGAKAKVQAILFSASLGWWGFPFGVLLTPVQLFRNIQGLLANSSVDGPSEQLETLLRVHLTADAFRNAAAADDRSTSDD